MSITQLLAQLAAPEVETRMKAAGEIWESFAAEIDRSVFGGLRVQLPRGATLGDVKGEVYLRVVGRLNRNSWTFSDLRHLLSTLRLMRDQVLHEFSRRGREMPSDALGEFPGPSTSTPSSKVARAEWLARQLAWWEEKKRGLSDEDRWLYEQRQLANRDWSEIATDSLVREGLADLDQDEIPRRANTLQRRWNRLLEKLHASSADLRGLDSRRTD